MASFIYRRKRRDVVVDDKDHCKVCGGRKPDGHRPHCRYHPDNRKAK